ncbi:hypothetical protein GCM10018773_62540 [Streptomyces candidus]|nr:hypothetical protein GCM10018773_62540 [Streptomyces candidus]
MTRRSTVTAPTDGRDGVVQERLLTKAVGASEGGHARKPKASSRYGGTRRRVADTTRGHPRSWARRAVEDAYRCVPPPLRTVVAMTPVIEDRTPRNATANGPSTARNDTARFTTRT